MIDIVAKNLKEIRKKRGLTQPDLAEGICTQAMVSNFEKGGSTPTGITLFEFAKKLNVDINYFFNNSIEIKPENEEVKKLIRRFILHRDYESINYIVRNELEKKTFKNLEDRQFLIWHRGICEYYLEKNSVKSLETLNMALNMTHPKIEEQELSIMNSIAIIYFEKKAYQDSLAWYKKIQKTCETGIKVDSLIQIKILFGFSRTLTYLEDYTEALDNCLKAIEKCIKEETLYLLGELLFQAGRISIFLEKFIDAERYLNKAEALFELEKNDDFIKIIQKQRLKLI